MLKYTIPKEVLDFAWKAPLGRHKISIQDINVSNPRLIKDGKMMLVVAGTYDYGLSLELNAIHIVAFPKKEHFEIFKKAKGSVDPDGPADWNPGGIGTIRLRKIDLGGKPLMRLDLVQAHYKAGKHDGMLPWDIVKQYAGWRKRALHMAIEIARQHKSDLYVPLKVRNGSGHSNALDKDLLSVCKEAGVKVSEVDKDPCFPLNKSALLVKLKK